MSSSAAKEAHSKLLNRSVDSIRGITLILIVLTHYVPNAFFSVNIARPTAAAMMVVTGYFFALVLEKSANNLKGNFKARLKAVVSLFFQRHMRIWPAIFGVILMYVALGYWDGGETTRQIHETWPLYLAYCGNVVKMIYEGQAFPAHFWLVSAQEQFLLILFIIMLMGGYARMRNILLSFVAIGVIARFVTCLLWMPDQPALATETPLAVADALSLGMLARFVVKNEMRRTRIRQQLLAAILVLTMVWASLPNLYSIYFSLVPLIAALIGCYLIMIVTDEVRVRRFAGAMRTWSFLELLGKMSLSLFLIHPLVNTLLRLGYAKITGENIDWWVLSLVGPPLSIVAAYLYFMAVEVPFRRMRRKIGTSGPKAVPATA